MSTLELEPKTPEIVLFSVTSHIISLHRVLMFVFRQVGKLSLREVKRLTWADTVGGRTRPWTQVCATPKDMCVLSNILLRSVR